jgi:hypothetical protein
MAQQLRLCVREARRQGLDTQSVCPRALREASRRLDGFAYSRHTKLVD